MMRTVIIFCLCLSAFAAQAQNDVNYALSSTYKCNFLGADNKQ